jgi:hypothetical protein
VSFAASIMVEIVMGESYHLLDAAKLLASDDFKLMQKMLKIIILISNLLMTLRTKKQFKKGKHNQ